MSRIALLLVTFLVLTGTASARSIRSADTAVLTRATRLLGPESCPVAIRHQEIHWTPRPGLVIFFAPACVIYVNSLVWTPLRMREATNPGGDAYRQFLWNAYCTDLVDAVARLEGRFPVSVARSYRACGKRP